MNGRGARTRSARRPRVLFVSHEASRTGAPIMFLHFLRWVRDNTSLDFEVLLLDGGPLVDDFRALGCRVHLVAGRGKAPLPYIEAGMARVGLHRSSDRMKMSRLRRQVRGLKGFDAIYMNSTTSALALRILPEIPPVVFSHIHELDAAFTYWFPERERVAMMAHTDWYVACAEAVSRFLVGHQGVLPEQVSCHYEFIDVPQPDPARAEALSTSLGIGSESLVVGGSGLAIWRKGPDLFLQAADAVVRSRPDLDVHFIWVGGEDPREHMSVKSDIARLGLTSRVHFVGEVTRPADLFSRFDVFCLTSREDPFPLVMLEAAALGVPIVSFANGGAVEFAGDAPSGAAQRRGVVVDYLDTGAMAAAVLELLENAEERAVLGKRGRERVLSYHTVDVAAASLYEDLMSRIADDPALDVASPELTAARPASPVSVLAMTDEHRRLAEARAKRWSLSE